MRWVEIEIKATDASADAVTNVLIEEGCGGTAYNRPSDLITNVLGYLPVDDRLESRLENIRERIKHLPDFGLELASDEISIKWVQDDEWATAWKQFFKPMSIGRIVIKPSWEIYEERPNDLVVEIDPGMAFGTGNHPTTKLCLLALQDYISGGETMLDMGTGSAILAIAGVKLGASNAVGLDIDPVAVEAAQENVKRSGMEDLIKIELADSPNAFDGNADIVTANIIANVIIAMADDLSAKVKPGGKLIASGIIQERAEEVQNRLERAGLRLLEDRREGEWTALIMERQK